MNTPSKTLHLTFDQTLTLRLEKLKEAAGITHLRLVKILDYDTEKYYLIRQGKRHHDVQAIKMACEYFRISVESLFTGDIDFEVVTKQFKYNVHSVPDRYADTKAYLTSARPIMSALKWTDATFGKSFTKTILNKIQVHRGYFNDPQKRIHPFIIADFFSEMGRIGIHPNQAFEIGKLSSSLDRNTIVGKTLSKAKDIKELYSYVHDGILTKNFDQLLEYRPLRISNDGVELEATPKDSANEILNINKLGDGSLCLYRQGVYAAFSKHIGLHLPKASKSSCIYQGHRRCVFHLNWQH